MAHRGSLLRDPLLNQVDVLDHLNTPVAKVPAAAECRVWLTLLCDRSHLRQNLPDFGRGDETLVVERQDHEASIDPADQLAQPRKGLAADVVVRASP
jgi:hypothetical protein